MFELESTVCCLSDMVSRMFPWGWKLLKTEMKPLRILSCTRLNEQKVTILLFFIQFQQPRMKNQKKSFKTIKSFMFPCDQKTAEKETK